MNTKNILLCMAAVTFLTSCKKTIDPGETAISAEIRNGKSGSGTGNGSKTGTMRDIDGNTYKTVTIGNQIWMAENLRVSRYRNGDPISNIQNENEWNYATQGAWCHFGNQSALDPVYGKLYNWYAVNDSRGLAPKGWHIPTVEEVNTLINYLGGNSTAGGSMKETGTDYWYTPNTGATNTSGFSARPGGYREYTFWRYINYNACFWTATIYNAGAANGFYLAFDYGGVNVGNAQINSGFSVRCVKD